MALILLKHGPPPQRPLQALKCRAGTGLFGRWRGAGLLTVQAMPYVRRDAQGALTGLLRLPEADAQELLADEHPEVQAFVGRGPAPDFEQLDAGFIRVLEDLIDLLIRRKIINLTDLPSAAQHKLYSRKGQRQSTPLSELNLLGEAAGLDSSAIVDYSRFT